MTDDLQMVGIVWLASIFAPVILIMVASYFQR